MQNTGGLQPEYKNYRRQKCFVGHSLGAEWCEDLKSACNETLPKFNLEPWYTADHFTPTQTLRDKVVELIANSRFGIYDISNWKDRDGKWQLPRNVYIELGIAIALNRPTLILCQSKQELKLPTCLQGIKLLKFTGDVTLKKELEAQLPQWIDIPPERDWLNRYCIFGNKTCSFREKHPYTQQWGQEKIHCHISDGLNKNNLSYNQSECDEIRGAFEEILDRYSDLTFKYLDEISIVNNYQYLLCSYCQTVRSTTFAIYRISSNTSAETFIAIGISIALEKLLEYKIPKVILVKTERDLPSLLRGYEVVEAINSKEIKQKLKAFLPVVMNTVRQTTWKPKPLPFIDISVNNFDEDEIKETVNTENNNFNIETTAYVENLPSQVTEENIKAVWSEYGEVTKVYLQTSSRKRKALVEMTQAAAATTSITALDGAEWMGHDMVVRGARSEDFDNLISSSPSNDREINNGQIKVYELSKELNLTNKECIEICNQLNIAVENHASEITETDVNSIRAAAEGFKLNKQVEHVYIGNLSYKVTEDDLRHVFSKYGIVLKITLPKDRETGRMRGFAFVEMETQEQVNAAVEELDGAEWMGRNLKVNRARPRQPR